MTFLYTDEQLNYMNRECTTSHHDESQKHVLIKLIKKVLYCANIILGITSIRCDFYL